MKTMLRNLLVVLAIVGWASAAPAAVLFTETFSYPNGALTSVSGGLWTRYNNDALYSLNVNSEKIRVVHRGLPDFGSPATAEDLKREFSALAAGQTVYAGFDVSTGPRSSNPVFAHFLPWPNSTGLSVTPFTGSDFTFGIGPNYSPTVSWPSGLTFGTTYRVVLSYEFDTGVSKLWVNPIMQSSTNISFAGTASTAMSAFGVRQDRVAAFCGGGCGTQVLDNLVIGTSFNDVLTIPPPTLLGDYNNDGTVDAADYIVWRKTGGTPADYDTWRANFGETLGGGAGASMNSTVPEPATLLMLIVAAGWGRLRRSHPAVQPLKLRQACRSQRAWCWPQSAWRSSAWLIAVAP